MFVVVVVGLLFECDVGFEKEFVSDLPCDALLGVVGRDVHVDDEDVLRGVKGALY